ncbi:PE family protein [Mycobacterium parmense]|nr:PE family protein [Mycobacterium parmense]
MAAPEVIAAAATDVAAVASTVNAAHLAAVAPTVALTPAAGDEVSGSVAQLFSQFGRSYQALAGEIAAFQEQFVHTLTTSAGSYASAEGTNVGSLVAGLHLPASLPASPPAAAFPTFNWVAALDAAVGNWDAIYPYLVFFGGALAFSIQAFIYSVNALLHLAVLFD